MAREAGRWAAEQEIVMSDRGSRDADAMAELAPDAKRGDLHLLGPPPSFKICRQCFSLEPSAQSELEVLMGLIAAASAATDPPQPQPQI